MADAEIQVILKVVDEMSAKLDVIDKNIQQFGEDTKKQSEKVANAFKDSTNSLIALGNAAVSVDNIFSAYQNQQIRLENANERLLNSQDSLKDAQRNLNKVMNDGTSSLEDVQEAQEKVERATRNLNIAQNNLERVNNQVVGTYLNMGVQITTLVASLPTLWKSIQTLTSVTNLAKAADTAWAVARTVLLALTNPFLLAIGLAAAAAGVYAIKAHMAAEATNEMTNSYDKSTEAINRNNISLEKNMSLLKDSSKYQTKTESFSNNKVLITKPDGSYKVFNDFIVRPGQDPIAISPSDTLIGMRSPQLGGGMGGGMVVNIQNVYGMNPADVSIALKRELGNKLRI